MIKAIEGWLRGFGILYVVLTLPLILVFFKNEEVRFRVCQTLAAWKSRLNGVSAVYVGDSITAEGRHFGKPLNAINLAVHGFTTWQIENQLKLTRFYDPEVIFILAGTNDILGKRPFEAEQFQHDYESLLEQAVESQRKIVVTLVPYTDCAQDIGTIDQANGIITKIATEKGISLIDLNPTIAPEKRLLREYTTDGIHFSDRAYQVWKRLQKEAVQSPHKQS